MDIESTISAEVIRELRRRGHHVNEVRPLGVSGCATVVMIDPATGWRRPTPVATVTRLRIDGAGSAERYLDLVFAGSSAAFSSARAPARMPSMA